ncbi:hypothetical protein ROZALSC1DRAFT_20254 [Rozella allomycis CSF55]|uniref:Uncharacterized protein n=1 Tax=Rozella allomycis (strain CSF55) TaxID=988480 RepID=A0A4P9YQ13_ROZAC|nr:hypothetical protein ROZALSC1DRAFT_20254 [Rozella allomycis CSF55]
MVICDLGKIHEEIDDVAERQTQIPVKCPGYTCRKWKMQCSRLTGFGQPDQHQPFPSGTRIPASLVSKYQGFENLNDAPGGGLYHCEEAIVECLSTLIDPKLLAQGFLDILITSTNPLVAGFNNNFELLILIKFYCDDPQRNMGIFRGMLLLHLISIDLTTDGCYIILPDNYAVKFTKALDDEKACKSVT